MKRGLVLILLAGCASPQPTASPPGPPPAERTAAVGPAEAPPSPAPSSPSDGEYRRALACFNRGEFEKAREAAQRAIQLDPGNLAARALLDDIHAVRVGTPAGALPTGRPDVRRHLVSVEQAQVEVAKHVRDGGRYLSARMYASAIREYEAAELKIRAIPYEVSALNDLLPEIREGLARARSARGE
ncbi:MAG TPA: tetratricopeptide repeat protein [Planctomycetota bacterium]|nr:tetratricopeptide repeat protein [Planctomycetota bacterium]